MDLSVLLPSHLFESMYSNKDVIDKKLDTILQQAYPKNVEQFVINFSNYFADKKLTIYEISPMINKISTFINAQKLQIGVAFCIVQFLKAIPLVERMTKKKKYHMISKVSTILDGIDYNLQFQILTSILSKITPVTGLLSDLEHEGSKMLLIRFYFVDQFPQESLDFYSHKIISQMETLCSNFSNTTISLDAFDLEKMFGMSKYSYYFESFEHLAIHHSHVFSELISSIVAKPSVSKMLFLIFLCHYTPQICVLLKFKSHHDVISVFLNMHQFLTDKLGVIYTILENILKQNANSFELLEILSQNENSKFARVLLSMIEEILDKNILRQDVFFIIAQNVDQIIVEISRHQNEEFWANLLKMIIISTHQDDILLKLIQNLNLEHFHSLHVELLRTYEKWFLSYQQIPFKVLNGLELANIHHLVHHGLIKQGDLIRKWKMFFPHLFGEHALTACKILLSASNSNDQIPLDFAHSMLFYFYYLLEPIRTQDSSHRGLSKQILPFLKNMSATIISRCSMWNSELFDMILEIILSTVGTDRIAKRFPTLDVLEETKWTLLGFDSAIDLCKMYVDMDVFTEKESVKQRGILEEKVRNLPLKILASHLASNEAEILELIGWMISKEVQANTMLFSGHILSRVAVPLSSFNYLHPKKPIAKYDQLIDKIFCHYPIFYDFLLLISNYPLEFIKYRGVISSLMANLIADWNANTHTSIQNTVKLLQMLQNSQWILGPLTHVIEIVDILSSSEIMKILMDISKFIISYPPKSNQYQEKQRKVEYDIVPYLENTKLALRNHISQLSDKFHKFY